MVPMAKDDVPLGTLTFLLFQTEATASETSLSPLTRYG